MAPDPALAHLHAPVDPRIATGLPAFGTLPREADLDEVTTRVLAPNASHMTLDGTNTYVLALPGSGAAVIIDPGPDHEEHRGAVEAVLARRDLEVAYVVTTHHHHDHAEAVVAWAERYGGRAVAPRAEDAGEAGWVIGFGDVITAGGLRLDVVPTPGHCHDHTAFRLPTGALLCGDHILGRGTAVIAQPDGDLVAYLESLRLVLDLGPDTLLPGHGPELDEDPMAVVQYYLDHRAFREEQILAVMADGETKPAEMVKRIYAEVAEHLWPAAQMSTRSTLATLVARGRVAPPTEEGDDFTLVD